MVIWVSLVVVRLDTCERPMTQEMCSFCVLYILSTSCFSPPVYTDGAAAVRDTSPIYLSSNPEPAARFLPKSLVYVPTLNRGEYTVALSASTPHMTASAGTNVATSYSAGTVVRKMNCIFSTVRLPYEKKMIRSEQFFVFISSGGDLRQ